MSFLLPNTIDLLQPLNIAVNKLAKEYLRWEFQDWYSAEVMKQLDGQDLDCLEDTDKISHDYDEGSRSRVAGWNV